MKKLPEQSKDETPAMPFNEALRRVWAAKPMPHVKPKPAAKAKKPERGSGNL